MKQLLFISMCLLQGNRYTNGQAPTGPFEYPSALASSQNIIAVEYFFDDDNPDFGAGSQVAGISPALNIFNFNTSLALPMSFSVGFHRVFVRSKDALGRWSQTQNAYFDNYIAPTYALAPAANTNIKDIEYFFDDENPLPGAGIAVTGFVEGVDINNFNSSITIPNTVTGSFHRLFIRSKDALGRWSLVNNGYFDNYTSPSYAVAPLSSTNIVAMEYFFDDQNPAPGSGQLLTGFTAIGNVSNFNTNVTIPNTVIGNFHRFFIRSKDALGRWSLTNNTYFDNYPVPNYSLASASAPPISKIEYYFDTDPGAGNGFSVPTMPTNTGNIVDFNFDASIGTLQPGDHKIFIRTRQNPFSLSSNSTFNKTTPALPIDLILFNGRAFEKGNELTWETASETNNAYFDIEKSEAGKIKFEKIGKIDGATNSNEKLNYLFFDENPSEQNFYRLKQVDFDGKYAYSKIISVKNDYKTEILSYPNPFSDKITIDNKTLKYIDIQLITANGHQIKHLFSAEKLQTISTKNLPKGIYILEINDGHKFISKKVIKE